MTLISAEYRAVQCAYPACGYWTGHSSGLCARCREIGRQIPCTATPATPLHSIPKPPLGEENKLESEVQIECIEVLRAQGADFWRVGQKDARGTQDPGVPDIIVFHPTRGHFYFEVKRVRGGRHSPSQKRFADCCAVSNVPYLIGGLDELIAYLRSGEISPWHSATRTTR